MASEWTAFAQADLFYGQYQRDPHENDKLVDGWCERRALIPLRYILNSYPLSSGLTDEWGALLDSLKDIKTLCRGELTGDEMNVLLETVNALHDTVYRRHR